MSQFIYIRIRDALLLPIPTSNATTNFPPVNSQLTGHLYLIEGTYEDIQRYAGTTVDWVIKVAQFICDPLGEGQLYTHTTGTPSDWYHLNRTDGWKQVAQGEPLRPGIYEFESTGPILLSKITEWGNHSLSTSSESSAIACARHIELRERAVCAVSKMPLGCFASYLVPKRLGSDGVKDAIARFSGEKIAHGIHAFDPRLGILLIGSLDDLVHHYQLGFYYVTENHYIVHNFHPDYPDLSILGYPRTSLVWHDASANLHRQSVTLSPDDLDMVASLPLKGAFDWHYLQCILNAFGTVQYKNFPNIEFFKTASDALSDECEDDNKTEPPYPSSRFDQYLAEQGRRQMARKRREKVVQWSSGIPSGI